MLIPNENTDQDTSDSSKTEQDADQNTWIFNLESTQKIYKYLQFWECFISITRNYKFAFSYSSIHTIYNNVQLKKMFNALQA